MYLKLQTLKKEETFIEKIKENEGLIFKITTIYGSDSEDRKDLYQEIVLQLWRAFEKFKNQSQVSTWIYRVALNTAISRLRKEKRNTETISFREIFDIKADVPDTLLEERTQTLYAHISHLNDIEKAVIFLFLEDKSHTEISGITGLTVSNVGTRMARIKDKLKQKINTEHV